MGFHLGKERPVETLCFFSLYWLDCTGIILLDRMYNFDGFTYIAAGTPEEPADVNHSILPTIPFATS